MKLRLLFAGLLGIIAFMAIGSFTGSFELGFVSLIGGTSFASLVIPAGITKSQHLRGMTEARAGLMLAIQPLADKETLTDEEKRQFIDLEKRIKGYDDDIAALETMIADERAMDEMEQRRQSMRGNGARRIDNEDKTIKRFNFVNYLREISQPGAVLTGLNAEMHQEAVREAAQLGVRVEGFGVPSIVLGGNKRDVIAGSGGTGKHLVTEEPIQFIDALREKLVLTQLGATFLTGLVGNVPLTSASDVAAAAWKDENATAGESTPTFSRATMSPKRLAAFIDLSKQLLVQDSMGIESMLINQLAAAVAIAIQRAAINGSGTAPEPLGILGTVGIGSVAIGDNGGAITWEKAVALETLVAAENADFGTLGYLTNSKVMGALKTVKKDAGSGIYLLENGMLNGYGVAVSNSVPSNLVKGSSGAACSAAIFGNWQDLAIGQWGGVDFLVNPYTKAKESLVEIVLNTYNDVKVLRPKSFAACVDITTA